jgi:hypothetical protein
MRRLLHIILVVLAFPSIGLFLAKWPLHTLMTWVTSVIIIGVYDLLQKNLLWVGERLAAQTHTQ